MVVVILLSGSLGRSAPVAHKACILVSHLPKKVFIFLYFCVLGEGIVLLGHRTMRLFLKRSASEAVTSPSEKSLLSLLYHLCIFRLNCYPILF